MDIKIIGRIVVIAAALALTPAGARAEQDVDTADFMLPYCQRFLIPELQGREFWQGVCYGRVNGAMVLDPNAFGICWPGEVTREQAIRVVVTYIEARPTRMHEEFFGLVMEALKAAWPCKAP
jgi:hypothetical protein